jgi:hypothetical protein
VLTKAAVGSFKYWPRKNMSTPNANTEAGLFGRFGTNKKPKKINFLFAEMVNLLIKGRVTIFFFNLTKKKIYFTDVCQV